MLTRPVLCILLLVGATGCGPAGGGAPGDVPEPRQDTSDPDLGVGDIGEADAIADDSAAVPDRGAPDPWDEPVPLRVVEGLPLFGGAVAGGPPVTFLFDTLAQVVFLDDDIVGDVLYHETELLLGDDSLGLFQVKGREMDLDEAFLGEDLAGLVGQAYIWKRFLVLDYPGGRFFQLPAIPDLAAAPLPDWTGPGPAAVDVTLQNAFPVVQADLGTAAAVPLLADTSSPLTTIVRSVFDAVDDGTLPRVEGYVWSSKYGMEDGFLTRLPSLRLGTVEVKDLEAVVIPDEHHLVTILGPGGVDVDGWLGAAFWERFAVGIDPLEGTEESPQVLYLWGDGAAPAAHAGRWDKVGVELAWRDGLAEVDSVYAGTDAEAQGIQRGDVLLSVDGTAVDALPLTEVRQLLRGAPGDTRTLSLAPPDGDPVTLPVLVEAILP